MCEDLSHLVGVIEDIKYPNNTRFFFPSKVGGKPAWLDPSSLPNIICDSCKKPMTFLLQLYAPDAEVEQAFHRSIMVFTCLSCRCFLKAFRVQLSLDNPFYSAEPIGPKDIQPIDILLDSVCCEICGMKSHPNQLCRCLPEYGIGIEEIDEIGLDDEDKEMDDYEEDMTEDSHQMLSTSDMTIDESEADLFNEFTETAIERDSSFRIFKRLVEEAPSGHVVYYSIGGSPVWLTEQNQIPGPPPVCEYCGSSRHFEFQIQPQLIFHIMKRLRGFPMSAAPFEWGVVCIYTCSRNCHERDPYKEEFVYNQLEPSEWLEFDGRKKVDFSKDSSSAKPAPKLESSDDEGEWVS
jgi:pre-rRNA-processing protein TSR4